MTTQAPVPSLRERRRARTHAELVAATLAVVAELGVDGVTIERIQAAAGVSRGTVYAYFPGGRDDLLRAAYAQVGTDLVAHTRDAVRAADGWQASIRAHADAMFDLAEDQQLGYFFNVSGPALITNGAERGIGSRASVAMIREALELAQSQGEVDLEVDAESAAVLLVGAIRDAAVSVAGETHTRTALRAAFARLLDGLARR